MNTSKTITLAIAGLVAIAIVLLVIQLLLKKMKLKSEIDGRLKLSYGIWFVTLFIAASIVNSKSISILSEAMDNIYKMNTQKILTESIKAISLFIGLSVVWFVIGVYVANFLVVIIVGKRKDSNEMEADNYSYFIIKGFLVIGIVFSLLPIFETLLRAFITSVQLPFYH